MTYTGPTPDVRAIRTQLGLTQEKFAGLIGVTTSTVNRWECGHANPSPMARRLLLRMASEAEEAARG